MIVLMGYRLVCFDRVDLTLVLVLVLTEILCIRLSLVVGTVDWLLVLSLPRIDWSVVIAVVNSCWLLKTGDGVGGNFRRANKSVMIKDNLLVAVIVRLAHVVGKKINSIWCLKSFWFTHEACIISVVVDCRAYIETTWIMVGPRGTFICLMNTNWIINWWLQVTINYCQQKEQFKNSKVTSLL